MPERMPDSYEGKVLVARYGPPDFPRPFAPKKPPWLAGIYQKLNAVLPINHGTTANPRGGCKAGGLVMAGIFVAGQLVMGGKLVMIGNDFASG
jgi:hypothetical protein